ncbi:MAG TPA: alcohol dehydrogenase catalytic domain-containing protein [Bacillota bacterium]|nr:alcohol dehydrogenase catalytic domain-containing protein [Bacillota bacterium]
MKAIVLYDKGGKYGFEPNWSEPKLQPGHVILKVEYCGVCGSDIPRFAYAGSYHHPMILGHEFAGEIYKVNKDSAFETGAKASVLPIIPCGHCEGCKTGEPFSCKQYQFLGSRNDGGFAEYCLVPESNLFLLPEGVSTLQGSLIEPMLVGLNTVRKSGFTPGSEAIVYGAGPIGLMTACWLRVFGATRIVISDLRKFSLNMAKSLGFDELYDPLSDDEPEGGFDYAFEAAGSAKTITSSIHMLRPHGTLTVVGRDTHDTVIPVVDFEQLMRKGITLKGCWGYNDNGEHKLLAKVLSEHLIPLDKFVTQTVFPDQAPEMIAKMINKSIDYCKVTVNFK